jgi:hypothetical protein
MANEPGAQPGNASPAASVTTGVGDAAAQAAAAAAQAAKQAVVDLATAKLEGDKVPEKFRGKTVAEVLKTYGDLEVHASKAIDTNKQWNEWYQKNKPVIELAARQAQGGDRRDTGAARQPGSVGGQKVNPFEVFEEPQIQALGDLFETAVTPLVGAITSIYKESVKSSRPDFHDYEERATQIFDNMPIQHRLDPKYGWAFAYNMAKAERMGTEPPPAAPNTVTTSGPGGVTKPPEESEITDTELAFMKRFGIESKEEAKKYAEPMEK